MEAVPLVKLIVGALLLVIVVSRVVKPIGKLVAKLIPGKGEQLLAVKTTSKSTHVINLLLALAGAFLVADANNMINLF